MCLHPWPSKWSNGAGSALPWQAVRLFPQHTVVQSSARSRPIKRSKVAGSALPCCVCTSSTSCLPVHLLLPSRHPLMLAVNRESALPQVASHLYYTCLPLPWQGVWPYTLLFQPCFALHPHPSLQQPAPSPCGTASMCWWRQGREGGCPRHWQLNDLLCSFGGLL